MAPEPRGEPRPENVGRGLLSALEDTTEPRLVRAEDRDWWTKLSEGARIRFAQHQGKKWTDEETRRVIEADPATTDYFSLAAEMGRSPGALRIRRSHMIHILRDEYGYAQKARDYLQDPKKHHKVADIGQIYRNLDALGILGLPVSDQWAIAKHLKQPSGSWRGDGTSAVLREQRASAEELKVRIAGVQKPRAPNPSSC
jgi:hypothetical protein